MSKLKKFGIHILAEVIAFSFDIILIGLIQLLLGYGQVEFVGLVYLIGLFHTKTRNIIKKILTGME